MVLPKKRRKQKDQTPISAILPKMLAGALDRCDDFIVTCEIDPDSGARVIHAMQGRFITPCMLRKLIGQAESQCDEGGRHLAQAWTENVSGRGLHN